MCITITQYTKTKNHNTNYYRRNKAERFNVLSCPHCNYETTGPKSALQAHIWSKHTLEHERPFQCPCSGCHRGFSARANLNKHILKQHVCFSKCNLLAGLKNMSLHFLCKCVS